MSRPSQIGRYEIVSELGHGTMGAVYRARDPMMDRDVAIKTILAGALAGPMAAEYRERFQREARAAGRLSHASIVTVFDVGDHEGTPYLVMEFVEGRTLASALDTGERYTFQRMYEIGQQLAEALGYAHAAGVIHRDIKPANILLARTPAGVEKAKITDFGVAKLSATQMTATGQLLGTPSFMPPEQFTGGPIDGRSDLFSLGVILYWMATGDKPFAGDTITAVSYKIVHTDTIPPRRLNPAIPAAFEQVILRCLEKDPAIRYQTGQELAHALEDLRAGRAVTSTVGPYIAVPGEDPDATMDAVPGPLRTPIASPAAASPRTSAVPSPMESRVPATATEPHRPAWSRYMWVVWLAAAVILLQAGYSLWKGFSAGFQEGKETQAPPASTAHSPPAAPPAPIAVDKNPAKTQTSTPAKTETKPGGTAKTETQRVVVQPEKGLVGGTKVGKIMIVEPPKAPVVDPKTGLPVMPGVDLKALDALRQMDAGERGRILGEMGAAQGALFQPIPKDKARLRIDASAMPESLQFTLFLDQAPVFRRAGRVGASELYGVFIPTGSHQFVLKVGLGRIRLGGSNVVMGEFVDRQERTLRITLEPHAQEEGKDAERALRVRLTLE